MEHVIVECRFDAPFSEADERAIGKAVDHYLAAEGGRWLRSACSKDRKRMICEFKAPDTETVVKAWAGAALPSVDAWPATVSEAGTEAGVGAGPGSEEVRWDG